MRIAKKLVRKLPPSVEVDDLFQCGMVGLLKALQKYDAAKGKFETYAGHRILGEMLDHLRSLDPESRSQRKFTKALRDLKGKSLEEIAKILNLTEAQLLKKLSVPEISVVSLDEVKEGEAPKESLEQLVGVRSLMPRERMVLCWLAEGYTQKEVAERLGKSLVFVSELKKKIFAKLKAQAQMSE